MNGSLFPDPPSDGPYAERPHAPPSPGTIRSDHCRHRHQGAPTSEQAYADVAPHAESMRDNILRFIRMRGPVQGATTEEIAEISLFRMTSVSARVSELKRDGLVVDSGRTRKTTSGSEAAVLVAVEPTKGVEP